MPPEPSATPPASPHPEDPLLASIARAEELAAAGDTDGALARARAVLEQSSSPKLVRRAGAVADRCGDSATAVRCWNRLRELQPWQPGWPRLLAQAAEDRGDWDEAHRIVRSALALWPNDSGLRLFGLRYAALSGRSNSLAEDASELAGDAKASDKALLEAARHLIGHGLTAPARSALARVLALTESPVIAEAAEVEMIALEILEAAGEGGSPTVPGSLGQGRPAVMHRCEGAETAVIVFTGLIGKIGVSVNVFQALLAPIGVSAVYLFDEDRVLHLNGNRAFGRGYEETREGLRQMLADWGACRLVCIGNSGGTTAALRYGVDLGAERILLLGGATTLDPEVLWSLGQGRTIISRLKRLVPHLLVDLRPLLESADPAPIVDVYYGAQSDQDRFHAERLAGLPNVRFHPVEGRHRHLVTFDLVRQHRLRTILTEAMSSPTAPPETPAVPGFPSHLHLTR